jgi:hypothetical protein
MKLLVIFPLMALVVSAQEDPVTHFETTVFGTTVVISAGLRGDIYYIPEDSRFLPKLEKMKPVGSIYTSELNIGVRSFLGGFPGVTERTEWFAIDYRGRFWIENPGQYTFALLSDDGSKLYIDGHTSINNDGIHSAQGYVAVVKLKHGWHQIRISYFQGPRTEVALVLAYAPPGKDDFLPPEDLAEMIKKKPELKPNTPEWTRKRQPAAQLQLTRGAPPLHR